MAVTILPLIDEAKCFQTVRELRWPEEVKCPHCQANTVAKRGFDDTQKHRQRYHCNGCDRDFDDLTRTVFAGHHQPLQVWLLCLYFMGLNLSNARIATELGLDPDSVHQMATTLREGIEEKSPEVVLSGVVEFDEVYVVAGHKGHPEVVKKKGRKGRRRRLKSARGRSTLEKEKPPVFGMIQRSGDVVLTVVPNVQQKTIAPIIKSGVARGTMVYTDEYDIYSRLTEWGFKHSSVNHGSGEYARDDDGDGKYEVHVNTMEGCWSLLRSWLRPHRGISQEQLPLYVAFFQFVHNARNHRKSLLESLILSLVA